jgi:hypothetical protein
MAKITIGLSPGRKTWMVINGIIWFFIGNVIALLVIRLQDGISIDVVSIYSYLEPLGLAPILRATGSQIEFNRNEIIYIQPLFKILCKWDRFHRFAYLFRWRISKFLDSRITTSKFIAHLVKVSWIME